VLDGLFALAQRLFGVTISRASDDPRAEKWHADVDFFIVADEQVGDDRETAVARARARVVVWFVVEQPYQARSRGLSHGCCGTVEHTPR
jgi:hypothetical protein